MQGRLNYLMISKIEVITKSTPRTIVPLKRTFSKPLLVWYALDRLSDPPKAPPTFESDLCRSIAVIMRIASMVSI